MRFLGLTIGQWGLVLNLVGSLLLIGGNLFMTEKRAEELGVSRYGGTFEENLKLPAVKALLSQRNWSIAGLIFLFVGFILQLI